MDTFAVDDLCTKMRPQFLSKGTLLLSPIDISELARLSEARNLSTESSQTDISTQILTRLTNLAGTKSVSNIAAVLWSSTITAKNDSLKMTDKKSTAHFLYSSLSLETGQLTLYDTLGYVDMTEHPFFSAKAVKNFFTAVYVSMTGKRKIRVKYLDTAYVQTGNSCGYLACFHAILAYRQGPDFITEYKFKNFIQSLYKIKKFLLKILQSDTIDFETVQIIA